MIIRDVQVNALHKSAEKRLREDLFKHVTATYLRAIENKNETQIKDMIESDIGAARELGIYNRRGILSFVNNEFQIREEEEAPELS